MKHDHVGFHAILQTKGIGVDRSCMILQTAAWSPALTLLTEPVECPNERQDFGEWTRRLEVSGGDFMAADVPSIHSIGPPTIKRKTNPLLLDYRVAGYGKDAPQACQVVTWQNSASGKRFRRVVFSNWPLWPCKLKLQSGLSLDVTLCSCVRIRRLIRCSSPVISSRQISWGAQTRISAGKLRTSCWRA